MCTDAQHPMGPGKARCFPKRARPTSFAKSSRQRCCRPLRRQKGWQQAVKPNANHGGDSPNNAVLSPVPPTGSWRCSSRNSRRVFLSCLKYILCELHHKIPHACPRPLSMPKRTFAFLTPHSAFQHLLPGSILFSDNTALPILFLQFIS